MRAFNGRHALSLAVILCALGAGGLGCTRHELVPLLAEDGIPVTRPHGGVPLEVVTRSTAVRDPLPVAGSGVVYGDFEAALGYAVSTAVAPWARKNEARRPEGWQLFVEVIQAEAEHDGARLIASVGVRATLRTRASGVHLGQTEASCRDGALVTAERGASVLYRCMTRIGRDLGSWLAVADPEKRPKASGVAYQPTPGGVVGASGSYEDADEDGDSDTPGEAD